MLGLLSYSAIVIGLGCLMPNVRFGRCDSLGALWLGGYALMVLLAFLCLAVLRLPPDTTAFVMTSGALAGIFRLFRTRTASLRGVVLHPVLLLPVVASALILLNDGIDYLPYSSDEFMNWLGNSIKIHYGGGYHATANQLHHLGYLPGWHFVLLFPWQVGGAPVLGDSAAAPFILHVALAGLIFDVMRHAGERRLPNKPGLPTFLAWIGLLLYMAAEGTGKLWIYVLLIEQPQIYVFTAILLYLYAWEDQAARSENVLFGAGILLAAAFLMKSSALTLVPAIVGAILLLAFGRRWHAPMNAFALTGVLTRLVGPLVLVYVTWGAVNPVTSPSCMTSVFETLSDRALVKAASRDAMDLAQRFSFAVWDYVSGYKNPVLVAALLGLVLMARRSLILIPLILAGWITLYATVLYWYHLSCFGDYYFGTLNSTQRFMRVVVQPLHALGLIALVVEAARLIPVRAIELITARRMVLHSLGFICLALAGWQVSQVHQSLVDISTRRFSNVDTRIAEARSASKFVERRLGNTQVPPLVQFIAQGSDNEILDYAKFFALGPGNGNVHYANRVASQFSWSKEEPVNYWQTRADRQRVRILLEKADVIWPIVADPWQWDMLQDLLGGKNCPQKQGTFALVREPKGYVCYPKHTP